MNTKLTTITTQYSKFSDNQVLTKGQLNQFLEYFEDQDHLSRISLSGVGIVCGFDVTYDSTKKEIHITKGYGVTTDGDLLALVEPKKPIEGQIISPGFQLVQKAFKTYTHYRSFDDSNATYAPFFDGETQIELLEVFPEEDIDSTNTTYTRLNTLSNAELNTKVVLLYLENYPKKGDLCTALDCDNQGIEQIARLRVLLVSSDDAKSITVQDPIYNEHDWYEYYLALPEIGVRRDILTCENTKEYIRLKQNYYKLIKDNETLADLSIGLDAILQKFGITSISSNISALFDISPSAVPIDFQYRYDVLKDLVDTYTEIKHLLLHLNVHCCPSIGSFPKHLLLGRLIETQTHYKSLRHRFYKSPIIGHEDTNLKKVKSLLNRVQLIVKNYLETEKGEEIKITPSQLQGFLSHKTIPFYYNVTNAFLNNWSYDKFQNFKQTSNLSYHTTNLSTSPVVRKPLLHSLDNYNFLRIEGIQGKSYRDALDQVLILKKEYGLNFDVKVLSINPTVEDIDLGEYRCEFEDLNVLLRAWTTEQECILASMADFFSGFTTDNPGENKGENEKEKESIKLPHVKTINPTILTKDISKLGIKENFKIDKPYNFQTPKPLQINKNIYSYSRKNIVSEHLVTKENTIGFYIKEAIEENKKGSVNDIKNTAIPKIEEAFSKNPLWDSKPSIKEFLLKDTVDLLTTTYILSEKIPKTIIQIDPSTIKDYQSTLDDVCELVNDLKSRNKKQAINQDVDDDQINFIYDKYGNTIDLIINQLSFVCCSGEKLAILLDEIEKRKEEILIQLQLSEFVKKHPGLRHYGGVPEGGTFVMAYLTGNAEDNVAYEPVRLELDFLEQPTAGEILNDTVTVINTTIDERIIDKRDAIPFNTNGGIIKLWDDRISTRFVFLDEVTKETKIPRNEIVMIGDSLEETVYNLADFLNNIWRVAGLSKKCKAIPKGNKLGIELVDQNIRKEENFIQFLNPAIINTDEKIFFDENEIITRNLTTRNTVIADFALPYMCCSDCAPVNFIVPKEPVSLSLPTPFICLDDTTTPIPFTVSPVDGEVKAIVEGDISGGVDQNDDGTYIFDAQQLHPSLLGTAIRFTVNNEETTAVITVYENPLPVVTVIEDNFIYNDDRTRVEVFFEVSGSGMNANSVFAWNFGDNSPISSERPNNEGIVSHVYTLPIDPNNTVSPELTVTNELCSNEAPIEDITFLDPVVNLTIEDVNPCVDPESEQEREISFNVQPQNATVTINGEVEGISIDGDIIRIYPQEFSSYDTAITFSVNGEAQTTPELVVTNKNDFASFECNPESQSIPIGTDIATIAFDITGLTEEQTEELGFNWDFGDGEVSSDTNPVHNYNTANLESGTHSFIVTLAIEGGPCGFVEIRKDIEIIIEEIDITFNLNDNQVCFEAGTSTIITGYSLSPNTTIDIQGNSSGISINRSARTIRLTSSFNRFNDTIQFIINGQVNTSETLIVRRKPVNINIDWSPKNISLEDGQDEITITFTALNYNTELYPGTNVGWAFEGGQKAEGQDAQVTFPLPSDTPQELNDFSVNTVLAVSGTICDDFTTDVTDVFVIIDNKINCTEVRKEAIIKDKEFIDVISEIQNDFIISAVRPTKNLYDDIIIKIDQFLSGELNNDLQELFGSITTDTVNTIFSNSNPSQNLPFLSEILKTQIRLFYNILHCQEEQQIKDAGNSITPVFTNIFNALEQLSNILFDKGNPDPEKLEGTLRKFFNDCLNDTTIAPTLKEQIDSLIPLIKVS